MLGMEARNLPFACEDSSHLLRTMKPAAFFHQAERWGVCAILRLLCVAALLCQVSVARAQVEEGVMDPQMQAVLDEFATLQPKRIETLSPAEAREQPTITDAVNRLIHKERGNEVVPEKSTVSRELLEVGNGRTLEARLYRPSGHGPFPVILFLHDGGWVLSDSQACEPAARALCESVRAVVVSADYRRAPEFKFPAAHDDALAAYRWVVEHARAIEGDPSRLAIVGEGAGGNMAVAVCEMAAAWRLPQPQRLVLICPIVNCECHNQSCFQNVRTQPLSAPMKLWFLTLYLNSPADEVDPRISLLRAPLLEDLPPTTIVTAEFDPLRTEDEELARGLREANVLVSYRNYAGVTHGFFGMSPVVEQAYEANAFVSAQLQESFLRPDTP